MSLVLGRDSGAGESGDLDVLAEAECAERLPERRVSRGESGGPIVAACAMARAKAKSVCIYLGLATLTLHLTLLLVPAVPRRPRSRRAIALVGALALRRPETTPSPSRSGAVRPHRRQRQPRPRNRLAPGGHGTPAARCTRQRRRPRHRRSPLGLPALLACSYLATRDHSASRVLITVDGRAHQLRAARCRRRRRRVATIPAARTVPSLSVILRALQIR